MIGSYLGISLNFCWKFDFLSMELAVAPLTAEFVLEPVLLFDAADKTREPMYMPCWPMKLTFDGETGYA